MIYFGQLDEVGLAAHQHAASLREEPLAPKCPPTLNEERCPGIADPVIHGQASAVLEPTPHVSGLSGDNVEIFWPPRAPRPPQGVGSY